MIKTIIKGRGTGKTTEIIVRMRENSDLIALVPSHATKREYPRDLHGRLFVVSDVISGKKPFAGISFTKILIDDGLDISPKKMAELYYILGSNNIDIDVYGSIE